MARPSITWVADSGTLPKVRTPRTTSRTPRTTHRRQASAMRSIVTFTSAPIARAAASMHERPFKQETPGKSTAGIVQIILRPMASIPVHTVSQEDGKITSHVVAYVSGPGGPCPAAPVKYCCGRRRRARRQAAGAAPRRLQDAGVHEVSRSVDFTARRTKS